MKKLILGFIISFLAVTTFGQSWTYKQGGDVFDGTYKTSVVIGKGSEFPYTKPLFVINVFKGETDKPNIYVRDVPSSICDNNKVLIKFDNDDYTFTPSVTSSENKEIWFLHFDELDFNTNSALKKDTIMESFNVIEYKIESGAKAVIRKEPNPNSKIIMTLNKEEIIDIFNYDANIGYWGGRFIDLNGKVFIGFINELFIGDLKENSKKTTRIINVPIIKEFLDSSLVDVGANQGVVKFLNELKVHKIMHLRLMSDCVKSDFEFSLSGSTAAVNFVFKK